MKYLLTLLLLIGISVSAGEYDVETNQLADFANAPGDTVAITTGDITIKYQLAPHGSDYTDMWASNYDNASTFDSLCVVDSIQIDSAWHYINVPTLESNYAWSGNIKWHFITGADTLSREAYVAENVGRATMFFMFDYDADSTCVNVSAIYQGQ